MKIARAINIHTHEAHEGTFEEVSNAIYSDRNVVRRAAVSGGKVDKQWVVTVIGDAEDLPEHLRRLGLEKQCVVCGRTFAANRHTTVCCSKECGKKRDHAQSNEIRRRKRSETETLTEWVAEADAAGMSYGNYVNMVERQEKK